MNASADNSPLHEPNTKEQVLSSLEKEKGAFVSGGALARELSVSRNSIWKAINALRDEGYGIENITGKGYRLRPETSVLSAASIDHYLSDPRIKVEYHDSIGSTNTRAKELAETGAPEGTLVVANEQTAGKGRQGRPFYSPSGTGVYFTLVLRPDFQLSDITLVTTLSACCIARAIDEIFDAHAQIKWVNDVFVDGHKVSGILTEASIDAERARATYLVVGIGINVFEPEEGFPDEAGRSASAICSAHGDTDDLRARLVARVIDLFIEGYDKLPAHEHLDEYRSRSLLDGRDVTVYEGNETYRAHVIGINDDFTLAVRLSNGERRDLSFGEVHIPSSQLT
ncbi:MAG: biotin--[acetyl-CoA-carboxylase] ligase [Coriobacteriales bacterium]|jgi:BirA family biotin operon repressor/biotin-[acetyl-CoA-carboxylase] ligase